MKLDILAIGVHPDDVELSAAGTIFRQLEKGYTVGILDLTEGQLGSRGTPETRRQEAEASSKIFGLHTRVNLGMEDGWFENNKASKLAIIQQLRRFQPDVVLANAFSDRHPDHGRASKLVSEACFYSGLHKVETHFDGKLQDKWRPKAIYHYIQDRELKPDFVVDISDYIDKKVEVIMSFKTQFYNPDSKEPETPISSKEFLDFMIAKNKVYARSINTKYAEAFNVERLPGVDDIMKLL